MKLTLRGHEVVGLSGGDGMLQTIERERPQVQQAVAGGQTP